MKAFFDKLSKENQNTSGSIRSLERSVMEVTTAVRENTSTQDEGNSLLKEIYKLNVIDSTRKRTTEDREKRESERRSADTSAFNDQGAAGRYGSGFGGALGGAANAVGFNGLTALGVGALGIQSLISGFESLQNGIAETFDSLNPFTDNEEEKTTNTGVTKADLALALSNMKSDKNADQVMLSSLKALSDRFDTTKQLEKYRDKNTKRLEELNESINNLRASGEDPTRLAKEEEERRKVNKNITETNINIEESIKMMQDILKDSESKGKLLLEYINEQRRNDAVQSGNAYNPLNIEDFKRRGGSISGDGNGDLVNARLERGEYVLNKNVVDGIGVATLDKLNFGTLPRFQNGGFVGAPKSSMEDTGYKDASGRPILLAPYAAKAFKDMIKDGMPFDSGSVNNVYRDEAEYNRLIKDGNKPAANGYHNFGEAADIQAGSAMDAWIRQNGAKYGWYANDYQGTHGGHFEYKGAGSGSIAGTVGSGGDDGGLGGFFKNIGGGLLGLGLGAISSVPILGDVVGGFTTGFLKGLGIETSNPLGQLFGSFAIGDNNGASAQVGQGSDGTTGNEGSMAPPANAKEVYDYMRSIGLDENQAKGLLVNAIRESSLRPGVVVTDVNGLPSGAFFQWNGPRLTAMQAAVPDWKTNWKAQIDYALKEPGWPGPQFKSTKFNSALDASEFWMNKWEVTADPVSDRQKHIKYLNGLGFNKGGLVPSPKDTVPAMLTPGEYVVPQETVSKVGAAYLRGLDNQINTAFREANNSKMSQQLSTMVMQPIIINSGGDSGGGSIRTEQSEYIPSLMNNSGVDFALDLLMTRHTLSSRIGG